MKNKEYWKNCLNEVLPNVNLTEKEIENIISISEMEYEYCSSESSKKSSISTERKEIINLKKDLELLKETICIIKKCESVIIDNGVVKVYNK